VALGYGGFDLDRIYTGATAGAVRRWQHDRGVTETGRIEPADVIVAPGAIRIAALHAHVGDEAGSDPLLDRTGTRREVDVALDVALENLVRRGTRAGLTLPDGHRLGGRVTRVGRVATAGTGGDGGNGGGAAPATVDVRIQIGQSALGTFDQAPVAVEFASRTARGVLTVPVTALIALSSGGYGLQLVTGDGTRYVAVRTGLFAGGRVEVSGAGISAGAVVGVAS
jgi:hypothetical protein